MSTQHRFPDEFGDDSAERRRRAAADDGGGSRDGFANGDVSNSDVDVGVGAERLIAEAFEAPDLRDEFVGALAEQLTGEFARRGQQAEQLTEEDAIGRALAPATNGAATSNGWNGQEILRRVSSEVETGREEAESRPAPGRVRARRLPLALAAAASVLITFGWWGMRPSYSWAAMIDALNTQAWVHTESVRDGAVRALRWVAVGRGVDATRTDGSVALRVQDSGQSIVRMFAAADNRVLEQRQQSRQVRWRGVLGGMLNTAGADAAQGGAVDGTVGETAPAVKVLDESWRRITSPEGRELIELTVKLEVDGRIVEWVMLLDPKSNLPVSAKPASGGGELRFSYPDTGPTDLLDLGVPADAPVVALRPGQGFSGGAGGGPPIVTGEVAALPTASTNLPGGLAVGGAGAGEAAPVEPEPELPPLGDPLPDEELTERIDQLLAEHWAAIGVTPAERSSDEEFLRRVYVDLAGRIPTVGEVRIFLEDEGEDRRTRLIDTLLASRDHATHLAAVWRKSLIPPAVDLTPYGGPERLDQWLADRFQDNVRYDELASELLLAEGRISESGPLLFYAALKLNPEEIAAQTSRVFLGVRLECAQCHDHPFDERLDQEDFWSYAALFAQISRPRGMMDITSPVLRVHDNNRGEVTLPDTDVVVPPRLPLSDRPVSSSRSGPSRREQFVEWLVEPHNERFAQATANRVWAQLFGLGLVEPVDDIREQNPAVSPELLELLGLELARSGFDLRRLIRQIVLSDAYQLSSAVADAEEANEDTAKAFARMNIKSFTAEQLYDAIAVATRGAAFAGRALDAGAIARVGDASRAEFVRLFEAPGSSPVNYNVGIPQALTLMNGGMIQSSTDLGTSGLLKQLSAPFFTDEQRVETLFLATLSRRPTDAESEQMIAYVAGAAGDYERQRRLGDVLWALLNTAEFTLNH